MTYDDMIEVVEETIRQTTDSRKALLQMKAILEHRRDAHAMTRNGTGNGKQCKQESTKLKTVGGGRRQ